MITGPLESEKLPRKQLFFSLNHFSFISFPIGNVQPTGLFSEAYLFLLNKLPLTASLSLGSTVYGLNQQNIRH